MSVRIQLNNPQEHYTNLDYISGNVILSCPNEETVTAVTVKLEGESHTQLQRPIAPGELEYGRNARDRERLCRENHKILYKIAQVFPTGDYTTQGLDNAMLAVGTNYTLPPGQHSWPFQFRLPVNNGCASAEMQGVGANFGFGV